MSIIRHRTASRRAPANLLDPHLMPLPTTSQEENEDDRVHPPLLITIRDQSSWTDRWIVEKFRSCFRFQSARNSKIFISLFTSHRDVFVENFGIYLGILNFERGKLATMEKKISPRRKQVREYVFLSPRKKNIWFAVDDLRLEALEATIAAGVIFLTGILTFRCFLRFNPVPRGASGRQVTKAGTAESRVTSLTSLALFSSSSPRCFSPVFVQS